MRLSHDIFQIYTRLRYRRTLVPGSARIVQIHSDSLPVTTAGPLELENGDYYYLLPKTRLTFPGTQTRTNVEEMFPAIFFSSVPSGEYALTDCTNLQSANRLSKALRNCICKQSDTAAGRFAESGCPRHFVGCNVIGRVLKHCVAGPPRLLTCNKLLADSFPCVQLLPHSSRSNVLVRT